MQKQNFEKQVQCKLDELSLTPSAPVWQKVEKEISQKKKRRFLAFWLIPLLFVGAAGTYWGLSFSNLHKSQQLSTIVTKNSPSLQKLAGEANLNEVKNPSVSSYKKTDDSTSNIQSTSTTATISINARTVPTGTSSDKTANYVVVKRNGTVKNTPISSGRNSISTVNATTTVYANSRIKNDLTPILPKEYLDETSILQPFLNNRNDQTQISHINRTSIVAPVSVRTNPTETIVTAPLAKPVDIIPAIDSTQNKKQEDHKAKWSWAVQASTGFSSLQTTLLTTTATTPVLYDNIFNSSVPPPSSSPAASNLKPSEIEMGTAFHINATIKRSLTCRLSATVGLQYSYFSTKNYVGQSVTKDTLVQLNSSARAVINQFYRNVPSGPTTAGLTEAYINKYHFIELPVGIEWRVLKNLPLRLQTGFSLSYLVASNALVFDPNAGIYYQGKDLLNSTQAHFFGNLLYEVWPQEKLGIHIGPYLQYGISGLQKDKGANNYHLLSVGIKTQVSFK